MRAEIEVTIQTYCFNPVDENARNLLLLHRTMRRAAV